MSDSTVIKAIRALKIGKRTNTDIYIHVSAVDKAPELVQEAVTRAWELFRLTYPDQGLNPDLVKLSVFGEAIGFHEYDDFDGNPHPVLIRRALVKADTVKFDDYSKRKRPQILHRKDSFVLPSYPLYTTFKKLTEQEEAAGLLNSNKIGYADAWSGLLKEKELVNFSRMNPGACE